MESAPDEKKSGHASELTSIGLPCAYYKTIWTLDIIPVADNNNIWFKDKGPLGIQIRGLVFLYLKYGRKNLFINSMVFLLIS